MPRAAVIESGGEIRMVVIGHQQRERHINTEMVFMYHKLSIQIIGISVA